MSKANTKRKQNPVINPQGSDEEMLLLLQKETFNYFLNAINPKNGLIADKTQPGSPCSITSVGMGLSCYIVGVEQGFISRDEAVKKTLTILRYFHESHQGPEHNAMGYKGFYYHFIDMKTGARTWDSELSTIDTALFMAGVLNAQSYYIGDNQKEREIRLLAESLYNRVDWRWALNGGTTLSHGWTPESGFLHYHWNTGYSEAHILYILAMGSPTFPIEPNGYKEWISTFEWKNIYNIDFIYAGPLFIHQMSHVWLDFKGIQDEFCKQHAVDYFENSHRATCIQQKYAIDNPRGFKGYGKNGWGISASDGPGPVVMEVDGVRREFFNYTARGIPYGPDDGTISPWAVVASLPFAPEIVLDTLRHAIERLNLGDHKDYGFDASFNATFPEKSTNPNGWVSPWQFGLNQGPIILMIENYRSGLIWNIMRKNKYIIKGLQQAGFTGGWLQDIK